ncbi:MAG TPA: response regulator transcription factor [Cyclobacteriaceae bacterium]|nr:response regulator transcription factor [Cyclobacteriaceae bacterium]HMV09916.1 response regulator transcription factor [Cyclobacteriaceae bacterium]HMV88866.1 response regulator transcription factor [Cyclobacteriaceae bacterium]HMW99654.1 response regulator transcription factor [Cyclobacteriaceae bacterium]HMX50969.1 response regulator transcription factor [Cyclobacteriaceae bacterium]
MRTDERIPVKKKVVIVEDDPGIREAYQIIINGSRGYETAATYGNVEALLKDIYKVLPDIVIMDVGLPGINGVEGTFQIKKVLPYIEVVIMTVYEDSKVVFESLKNGASGYISKSSNYMELLNALDEIGKGGAPMSSRIARMVVKEFYASGSNLLTRRETEVLQLIAGGKTYTQIAEELSISKETTKVHTRNIYRKLQANTKAEAVSIGFEKKIITR